MSYITREVIGKYQNNKLKYPQTSQYPDNHEI